MTTITCDTGILFRFGDFKFGFCENETYVSSYSEKEAKRVKINDIPKTDGGKAEEAQRASLQITFDGHCSACSYGDLRTRVNALKVALMNGKQNFYVDEERYIVAQLKAWSVKYPSLKRFAKFKASLLSDYPFWRSVKLNSDKRTPSDGTGFAIYNSGNAPAKVKVTIVSPVGGVSNDIEITNETRGEAFRFNGDVVAGDSLIIDNRVDDDNEFVVTNDGVDANANFEGDYLVLSPGRNVIVFDGTVGLTTLEWRDTWT